MTRRAMVRNVSLTDGPSWADVDAAASAAGLTRSEWCRRAFRVALAYPALLNQQPVVPELAALERAGVRWEVKP